MEIRCENAVPRCHSLAIRSSDGKFGPHHILPVFPVNLCHHGLTMGIGVLPIQHGYLIGNRDQWDILNYFNIYNQQWIWKKVNNTNLTFMRSFTSRREVKALPLRPHPRVPKASAASLPEAMPLISIDFVHGWNPMAVWEKHGDPTAQTTNQPKFCPSPPLIRVKRHHFCQSHRFLYFCRNHPFWSLLAKPMSFPGTAM